jgi:hypothetical protein
MEPQLLEQQAVAVVHGLVEVMVGQRLLAVAEKVKAEASLRQDLELLILVVVLEAVTTLVLAVMVGQVL